MSPPYIPLLPGQARGVGNASRSQTVVCKPGKFELGVQEEKLLMALPGIINSLTSTLHWMVFRFL